MHCENDVKPHRNKPEDLHRENQGIRTSVGIYKMRSMVMGFAFRELTGFFMKRRTAVRLTY
jgi:hypothetical protein